MSKECAKGWCNGAVPSYAAKRKRRLCGPCLRADVSLREARYEGKGAPELRELSEAFGATRYCGSCGRGMVLFRAHTTNDESRCASLQHWPDGSWEVMCMSCNSACGGMTQEEFQEHKAKVIPTP